MSNRTRGVELARRAALAESRWTRLRGLLGRPPLGAGEGMVIAPSRGVHTWGMGYPIDVALTDADGRVVALYPGLRPWSRTRIHRDAARAFELPAGTLDRTATTTGDRLEVLPPEPAGDRPASPAAGGPR